MANWKTTEISLGELTPGSVRHVKFDYVGKSSIKKAESGCSCSVAKFENKFITVKFTAPQFPSHLKLAKIKETAISRNIKVTTEDGDQTLLVINAIIKDV
jgi:hypothetical protein